ncbi:nucleoid-structuring protein H-NS [Mycobacterium decipiens]|uniref:Nucleoid-structuring protein H-NS n=1 Tax=Mycobacterium decipiens TaxID=1430326 RepID=A0A1X2LWR3_9MYCO|nr:nucleoid-structuring protein H-NS [Mycobacterium decipiens]OSC41493.1 nucleoid-structuring protein H-NS [Mycobacterium decipiens]
MADPQDRPDSEPGDAPTPPAKRQPAKKAVKKAPAKKAPAKKAPAKKAPAKAAKSAPPTVGEQPPAAPVGLQQRIETNGQLDAAAKDAAAQAKSAVEGANDPLAGSTSTPSPSHSPVPLIIAVTLSLLALLLIRQLRRR